MRHCTSANEAQQIIELMSITLLETAHQMLSSARMAKTFPINVVSTVSYLVNGSLLTTSRCLTHEEVWSSNIVDCSILRSI